MSRYSESSYTPDAALGNIGAGFWRRYENDLLAYAKDRSKTEIPERIHSEWDSSGRSPAGTDIRIEWALALFDHGDWPGYVKDGYTDCQHSTKAMREEADSQPSERRCANCFFSKNPESCSHGMMGPCEDWKPATEPEDHWPTWDDMKRAQYADYRSRYRD